MESARPAGAEDLGRCVELIDEALGALRARRGGRLLVVELAGKDGAAALVERFTSRGGRLVVGCFEDSMVGLGAGSLHDADAARIGRIELIYVEPAARGVGVGRAITESLLAWFHESGCGGIDALALPGDRATKQLFEASHFKTRLLVLHRPIE
ncbi:MAG: GNAT family N-acetyltransferase [Acidimicrobiales bacterium]